MAEDARTLRSARSIGVPASFGVLAAIVAIGLAIRLPFVHDAGVTGDMDIFAAWLRTAMLYGPGDLYAKAAPDFNYPPGSALMFVVAAAIVRHFGGTFANMETAREAIKLPSILADLACAVIAFDIVRRIAGRGAALAAAALEAFNPASIYISAFWGQYDAIPVAFALAALQQVLFGSAIVAWPLLVFAVLVKPQVVLLGPLFAVAAFGFKDGPLEKRRISAHAAGIAIAALLAEVLATIFFPHRSAPGSALALVQKMRSGSAFFPYTTLNAFNVWALFSDFFASDGVKVLGLKLHVWGLLAFAAVAIAIYARYASLRTRKHLLEACALVMLGFFCILTEMHERYIYFALPFFALSIFDRRYAIASGVLALTALFNLEYAYVALALSDAKVTAVNVNEFAPCIVRLCSLANVGLFAWLFADFLGARYAITFSAAGRDAGPIARSRTSG